MNSHVLTCPHTIPAFQYTYPPRATPTSSPSTPTHTLLPYTHSPLVSAAMGFTGSSCKPVHCNEGDAAYPSVMCHLGQALAQKTHTIPIRQRTALGIKSCEDTSLMHMVRCLFVFHAQQGISLVLTIHWLMLYHVTMLLCFFQRFPMWTRLLLT